ncbi:unnamed protein product [Effrenium voratum]|uniref:Uncharacterized protein n=1 Tax=Effrenium voratum TaxID=2562239 RepID=A0AA36NF84_9DINO|nr:unnamed protein product [Effrenium voratum]CAJ1450121.1 unnamed protein product [Effrenium voratum]
MENAREAHSPVALASDPRLAKLPAQWLRTSNGSDPLPDPSSGPIYKVKSRGEDRQRLELRTDEGLCELCKEPGSVARMDEFRRWDLKLSDVNQLMDHYDQLAGYVSREVPQNTLFCGPVAEETWRMRRKNKTGTRIHRLNPNLSCNDSQFTSHAHARFFLEPCDETAPTREEAPFHPRKLNKFGYMELEQDKF